MNIHNIIKVYKRDWKSIIINPIACIIVAGICIIPSLYAWINIKACWNTYENTSTIPVAVVNNDKKVNFNGKSINIGKDVVSKLKDNHKIGWVFVNSKQANLGLVDGTYYAMIEIPEDFSSDFLSVISDKPKKPQIIYKVDTKVNPVAGKITEIAKNSLVNEITSNFVSTVNETVFASLNSIGKNADENKSNIIKLKNSIIFINNNMDTITNALQGLGSNSANFSTFLRNVKATMPSVENNLNAIEKSNTDNAAIIKSTQDAMNKSLNNIDVNLNCAEASNERICNLFKSLNNSIALTNSNAVYSTINQINTEIDSLNSSISVIVDYLEQCNSIDFNSDIDKTILSLKNLQTSLTAIKRQLGAVQSQLSNASLTIDEICLYLDEEIPKIDTQIENINQIINFAIDTLEKCNAVLNDSELKDLISSLSAFRTSLNTILKNSFSSTKERFDNMRQVIKDTIVSLRDDVLNNTNTKIDILNEQIGENIKYLQSISNNNNRDKVSGIILLLQNIQQLLLNEKSVFNDAQQQLNNATDLKLEAIDNMCSYLDKRASKISSEVESINKSIDSTINDLEQFNNPIVIRTINLLKNIEADLTNVEISLNEVYYQLSNINNAIISLNSNITDVINKIDKIDDTIDKVNTYLQSTEITYSKNKEEISGIIVLLKNIQPSLNDEKKQFSFIQNNFIDLNEISKGIADSINNDISNVDSKLTNASKQYNSGVKDNISTVNNSLIASTEAASDLIDSAQNLNSQINNLINTSIDGSNLASKFSSDINSRLLEFKGVISLLSSKLQLVNNNDIAQIISVLESNPKFMGDFISNPFNISDESINEIPNYGSSMAPIYTVLALWVGCLILNAILKTDVGYFEGIEKLSLRERHFGKMMIYSTLAAIQGFIVSMGDEIIVHVYTVNPVLMVVFAVVSSLTFSIITYTLSSTLGNIGKALSIVYMILQLAGSGGTYPIQVDPKIFRILQPLFPFTYSVGGFREAIAGPLVSSVVLDFVALFLFSFGFLLFGFFFKEPLYKRIHKFEVKFKESGVGE